MASHEGSRKRMRMSRNEARLGRSVASAIASSSNTAQPSNPQGSACTATSCEHGQALKLLNTDVEAMRQLVTCKICDRLMYEPYALSCGHTYCYQCLGSWFGNNPQKKTCPDCRVVITQQPTPSYILREIVLVFTSRNELLPDGETSDEHHQWSKEEADLVAKDKANTDRKTGGLFKGMFKRGSRYTLGPIHDPGDGVDRCPVCHWELEDTYCSRCDEYAGGRDFSDYDDESDFTDDELDHELDEEDAAAFFGADGYIDLDTSSMDGHANSHLGLGEYGDGRDSEGIRPHFRGPERGLALMGLGSDEEEEQDEHASDVDADGNLRSFVVGDDDVAYAGSDEGDDTDVPVVTRHRRVGSRRSPLVIADDDDTVTSATGPATEEDDEDSEDEGPIARGSQRNKRASRVPLRQRHSRRISSDESSSDTDNSEGEDDHEHDSNSVSLGGFSPLNEGRSEALGSTQYGSDDNDDDDLRTVTESNDDDDDDGWDTDPETPRNTRSAGPTGVERLGQYGMGHPYAFGGQDAERASSSRPRQSTSTNRSHVSTADHPRRHPTYSFNDVGRAPRTVENVITSRSRAPSHPFQLSDTLARVHGTYNQRLHSRPGASNSRHGYQSSSSSGRETTPRPAGDVRRKRALSIDSDDTVEASYGGRTYSRLDNV